MVEIFDWQIWLGWLMIAALLYGLFPSLILGRIKRRLAEPLHDKVLFADAKMNQADWLTAGAAIIGVVGIGFGVWWLDAAAAIVISLDILHDGQKFLRESVGDLMDEAPKTPDESEEHPLVERVGKEVAATSWVRTGAVRLREDGHLITGDVWLVPRTAEDLDERVAELASRLDDLDWRLSGIAVMPVPSLEGVPEGLAVGEGS
jgi:divalent metal cation (Fe/Co/Zn/Cd) transporter